MASYIVFAVYVPSSADVTLVVDLYNFTVPYVADVVSLPATAPAILISPVVSFIDNPFSLFTLTTPSLSFFAGSIVIIFFLLATLFSILNPEVASKLTFNIPLLSISNPVPVSLNFKPPI